MFIAKLCPQVHPPFSHNVLLCSLVIFIKCSLGIYVLGLFYMALKQFSACEVTPAYGLLRMGVQNAVSLHQGKMKYVHCWIPI